MIRINNLSLTTLLATEHRKTDRQTDRQTDRETEMSVSDNHTNDSDQKSCAANFPSLMLIDVLELEFKKSVLKSNVNLLEPFCD